MASHAASHPHESPRHSHRPLAAIIFVFLFFLAFYCRRDPATWLHIRTGAVIAELRTLPSVDSFSYTAAGRPWTTSSWLVDWIIFELHSRAGPVGVLAVQAAAVGLAFALLLPLNSANPVMAAGVLSLVALATRPGLGLVPACFDLLPAALMIRALRPHRRMSWLDMVWVAAVELAWANVGGATAILGVWLAGLKSVEMMFKHAPGGRLKYWGALFLAVIAWGANPQGWGLLSAFLTLGDAQTPGWAFSWAGWPGVVAVAGFFSIWICLQQEFFLVLTAASFLALAWVYPGLMSLALMSSAPVITLALGHFLRPWKATRTRVARLALALAAVLAWHWRSFRGPLELADPYTGKSWQGALAYLKANGLTGRVFNEVESGDLLIGLGDRLVFVDSRADLYGPSFMQDVALWPLRFAALDAIYRFDYALLRNRRAGYPAQVLDEGPWQPVYADDAAMIYVKKTGANASLARGPLVVLKPNRLWPEHLQRSLSQPGRAAKILEEIDRWMVVAPDSAQPLLWKAYVLDRLGMSEKSSRLIALAQANSRMSWDAELQACLAFVRDNRGELEAAKRTYRQAANRATRGADSILEAEILERLALLARRQGDEEEALRLELKSEELRASLRGAQEN